MGNKLVKIGLGLGLILSQTGIALAAGEINIQQNTTWVKFTDIGNLISAVVGLAIMLAALMAFLYLVWGGIEWISSGGDKAGMEAARSRITAAFVGLAIVAAAWAIMMLIQSFFGITILGKLTIPSVVTPNQ